MLKIPECVTKIFYPNIGNKTLSTKLLSELGKGDEKTRGSEQHILLSLLSLIGSN
jgi:hypothetical protein